MAEGGDVREVRSIRPVVADRHLDERARPGIGGGWSQGQLVQASLDRGGRVAQRIDVDHHRSITDHDVRDRQPGRLDGARDANRPRVDGDIDAFGQLDEPGRVAGGQDADVCHWRTQRHSIAVSNF